MQRPIVIASLVFSPVLALVLALQAFVSGAALLAPPALAQDLGQNLAQDLGQYAGAPELDDRSDEWLIARGGRLYDNWFAAQLYPPPETTHPLMPAGSGLVPASTWRCSTCHGWDYLGNEVQGAERFMPRPSLEDMRARPPHEIAAIVRAEPHGYDKSTLPDVSLDLLARFVSQGQHDLATFADPATGAASGHPLSGRPIYQGVCISCHDSDGRAYLEGEPGDKVSLGWLARNRTAQTVHKIVNGQPGTDMVQLRFLSADQIADLLAYLQTLPDPAE